MHPRDAVVDVVQLGDGVHRRGSTEFVNDGSVSQSVLFASPQYRPETTAASVAYRPFGTRYQTRPSAAHGIDHCDDGCGRDITIRRCFVCVGRMAMQHNRTTS
mmetsp:Transcript_27159/g.27554  ORF Transcript_27159/g.27554 Transcript_27159/m.27554 type:complete len:103 (+) Transcript_27159:151-459(+)